MFTCLMNPEEREQLRISREIQKMLDQDKRQQDKELKLLLLGKEIACCACGLLESSLA